jgi:hypothetical protein
MKKNVKRFLSIFAVLLSVPAYAEAPQLGEWQLLFENDDGRAVALDVYRETPVILDEKGHIYFLNKEIGKETDGDWFGEVYENWQKVSGGGVAMDISVDGDGVPWVVGKKSRKIYYLDGDFAGPNRGWIEHPGNGRASRISVAKASGTPYMVGAVSGRVFKGYDNGWQALPTRIIDSNGADMSESLKAIDIYAKSYTIASGENTDKRELVFAISQDTKVFLYYPAKNAWQELPGGATATAIVTSGKLVYIIGADGKFYGTQIPDGQEWAIAGKGSGKDLAFSQVSIFQPFVTQGGKRVPSASYRYIWTIGEKGKVYRAFVAY